MEAASEGRRGRGEGPQGAERELPPRVRTRLPGNEGARRKEVDRHGGRDVPFYRRLWHGHQDGNKVSLPAYQTY